MKYSIDKIYKNQNLNELINTNEVIAKKKYTELKILKKKVALEREKEHEIKLLNQQNEDVDNYQNKEIQRKSVYFLILGKIKINFPFN